jgi:2-polyprenyl-3-methyl-5-hydroxy-6-metoxy-1,4-benzoquinol methylase
MSNKTDYALGYSDREHRRLIGQAERFHGISETFFRAAGICDGLRVLDLGSGVGDVAMLAASIVGPAGTVVGIERDPRSVERARDRVAQAGLANVTFVEGDVAQAPVADPFDAVIGRFILQFLPDPIGVLRSAVRVVRPQGIVAIQEVSWAPARAANSHLALWSACASIVHDAIRRAGAQTDPGLALHRVFQEAGLPAPQMRFDMQVGASRELVLWVHDLLLSVQPQTQADRLLAELGDLGTLADRLAAEVATTKSAVTSIAVIGAWSSRAL